MKRLLELATFSLLSTSIAARAQTPLPPPPPTAIAPAPTLPARADVEATGQAPIANGDKVRARQRALDESWRSAVEQAATGLVGAEGLAERASLLKLQIYPKARTYIGSYRVLEEGDQAGGGMFRMRIAAVVDLARLERDLALRSKAPVTTAKMQAPHLWLCFAGEAAPNANERASALLASQLPAALARAGAGSVAIVDGHACPGSETNPVEGAAIGAAALRSARAGGAQAALVGQTTVLSSERIRGTSQIGAHVKLELRMLELDGRAAATGDVEHDGFGADLPAASAAAISDGVGQLAATIAPAITRRFPDGGAAREGAAGVAVRLEAGTPWADLQLFQKNAAAVPGVIAVEPRRFSQNGIELFLRGDATAPAVAAALARLADGARFLAAPQGEHALTVRVVPAAEPAPPPQSLPPPPPVSR